jgi:soluble P-type ATPase
MITCEIPGHGTLTLRHLVCDVNGTLALDGNLIPGVKERLADLCELVEIHLVTADTLGRQSGIDAALKGLLARTIILQPGNEAEQKMDYVQKLSADSVASIGQGANDRLMLKNAALGICVLSPEGSAVETLLNADIVAPDILHALDLLLHPTRLKASLRR